MAISKAMRNVVRSMVLAACAVVLALAAPAMALAGEVTVTGDNATDYLAYQVFSADVADGRASNVAWGSAAARDAAAKAGAPTTTAQDAADWINANLSDGNSVAYGLASALMQGGATPVKLTAGKAATLQNGYWLIVADESALGEQQSGTAPVFVLVGDGSKSVKPKSAVPTVTKHVQENSTSAWQKAADATVGDDVLWRLEATVPAGVQGYTSYDVVFADTMSAGLDPGKVASSARVYVKAGTGSAWVKSTADVPTTGEKDAAGWQDVTAQCTIVVEGQSFSVKSPNLVATLGADALKAGGAQVCVIYNAPLNQRCNHGAAEGNPNEVVLKYPKSPFSHQEYLSTPKDDATAYTWDVLLTKRSSAGDAVLSGAVLGVTDPQGRHLAQDGSWHKSGQTVTTNAKGQVRLSGVDSGTYRVSEARAPEGYRRFEGTRKLVLTVTGLDVRQVASAHPTLTIQAESPLRADAVESSTSLAQASVLNTPTTTVPPSSKGGNGIVKTGDLINLAPAALLALAGAGLAVMGLRVRKRGEKSAR